MTQANLTAKPSPIKDRLPVVLVHGIWNTAGIFTPLKLYLEQAGWEVHALSMTPNNGDAPLENLAEQVAEFVDATLGTHQPFHLIGFSMGGLISRYYVQRLGGIDRVQRFITVSTPHQGTALGTFSRRYGIRQMRPGSAFIKALNQDIHQLHRVQFCSLWTPFDLLILPPKSSDLSKLSMGRSSCGKALRSHRIKVLAHNRMVRDSLGLATIAHHLTR